MSTVTGDWSRAQMTAFLEDATIPIRLSCHTPSGGLWMLSLWYRYRDGRFEMATGANADVVRYLRKDDGVAFEVSTNEVPYRGVRGAGEASIEADEEKTVLRSLIERYLGGTESRLARSLLSTDREEVRIVVEPTRLYTWDFSERMADAVED
jgi:nitroimidazol reductase NimA-like FMN-containing flavoprotein (pyridoxamine 5'-phosphate oxidase superfamily)